MSSYLHDAVYEEAEMNLMALVDVAPFIREWNPTLFTGALVAAGYRPYYYRPSGQTVWATSLEDVKVRFKGAKLLRMEKETRVNADDVILVATDDVPDDFMPITPGFVVKKTPETKRLEFARWLYLEGRITEGEPI